MQNVLYIQIDEDISSILQRMEHFKEAILHLVVPKKAILFQSSVNLGILKRRLEENNNQLILITTDRIGRSLAKNVGINVQSNLLKPSSAGKKIKKKKEFIHPIQARRNEVRADRPRRTQKKFTIGQLIQELREKKPEKKEVLKEKLYNKVTASRPVMLGLIFILSVGIFFLISYIALPAATISIQPAFETLSHSTNVVLVDSLEDTAGIGSNVNVVAAQVIESTATETRLFTTTGKRFEGQNASGQLTIINTAREQWPLVEQTRFQTSEGIVFRIQSGVIVPAATADGPGTLSVTVVADEFDIFKAPVGDRGNIDPTRFSIPGLSAFNQERIWAESSEPMTGGVTAYSTVVTAGDIEAAQTKLEEGLILIAKEELTSHLDDLNQLNQTHWVLLNEDRYIKSELIETRLPEGLEGSDKEKFEVYAEVAVSGIAYDAEDLFDFLRKELKKRAHPDMMVREDSIDGERITFEFVDEDRGLDQMIEEGEIKLTVTVDGIQEFVIDSSLEAGLRFSEKVKEKIINLPLEDTQAYLNNLPEVEEVQIKMWPIWLNKMPRLPEKIEVKLLD